MKIITPILRGVLRLKLAPELSREAHKRLKWFDYYETHNHNARLTSPLNVNDFLKITNVVNIDEADLKELGRTAQVIASAEGLEAHARAVEKRLKG